MGSVFAAYSLVGLSYLFLSEITRPGIRETVIRLTVPYLAAIGFLTGIGSMLGRKGKEESIALAMTTVAAFVLLVFALAMIG
jgi:hypothetical protein